MTAAQLSELEAIVKTLASFPSCDCIASGNANKPKQHGADPHAKSCAIYITPNSHADARARFDALVRSLSDIELYTLRSMLTDLFFRSSKNAVNKRDTQ